MLHSFNITQYQFFTILINTANSKDKKKIVMIPDNVLRKAIDQAYTRYDRNHSNTLDKQQLESCFRDVLHLTGSGVQVNSFIVGLLMKKMDKNHDGQISKPEFLDLFRFVESASGGFLGGNSSNNNNNGYNPNQYGNNQYGNNQYGNNQYGNNQYGNNQGGYGNNQGGYGYDNNNFNNPNNNNQPQQQQHWWNKFTQ